ncbi:uncharacterized protein LOC124121822 [Haliotis rufescens]|uniref:uncharacterized protein LOC124121822 n=1 Tax=Haliotis rufescens TaxID=6454 RepID=UPI00201F7D94|nr:uncharacterized protein LOC124121822 [Haliotis rufescens]
MYHLSLSGHFAVIAVIVTLTLGETTPPPPTSTVPTTDKLEEAVITSLLKIVDEKFDTLSSRIAQMERALNGLQFFNIRQFRGVTNTLQTTAALTQAMHSKLGTNDLETRTLKSTVTRIGHDMSSLKETNSKMFQQLERSIVYINRNIEKKTNELMTALDGLDFGGREERGPEEEATEQAYTGRQETVLNCTVDIKVLEERIDLRFNHLRNQSHFQYEQLRNQSSVQFDKLKYLSQSHYGSLRTQTESQNNKLKHQSASQFDKLKLQSETNYQRLTNQSQGYFNSLKYQSQSQFNRLSNISQSRTVEKSEETYSRSDDVFIDNEMLFHAITNMTSHIVQSVSFIRHTDSMLEQIISNTETLAYEQGKLRKDVVDVVVQSPRDNEKPDPANNLLPTGEGHTNVDQGHGHLRTEVAPSGGCSLPESVLKDIAKFSQNGSQLFEILTDLAQMSQVSLSSSLVELQDELLRMEETRTKLEKETKLPPSYGSGDSNLALQKILNTSKATLKMTEAMASNTGWIPYIFHNVQYVEGQLNRSMSVTTRFLSELRSLTSKLSRPDPNAQTQAGVANNVPPEREGDTRNGSAMTQENVLEFIYDTSVKLKRIMPALTRLIAEPEPLITLVDGRNVNEGRVEIYHKGQWGTICNTSLGHTDASAICRHLGYLGGIAAGRGQFGSGSGINWDFNVTCLRTFQCPVISLDNEAKSCSHHGDFAVICDHMLRLVAFEESNDVNTGLVEIYHSSRWMPICSHGFGRNEAQVACQQMGYTAGWMRNSRDRSRNSRSLWMTNVQCRGTETRLDACRHNNFGARQCPGLKSAAVTCE